MPRAHGTLPAVIDEILSQTVGTYRNKLEEQHDELSDPATIPEAVALAKQMEHDISFASKGGVEIALRGMAAAAGVSVTPTGTVIDADALTVFKALQLLHSKDIDATLERYVTFDFETTDKDVETCGVVEIGAARVVHGEIVARFHSLVNPYRPISPAATKRTAPSPRPRRRCTATPMRMLPAPRRFTKYSRRFENSSAPTS